MGPLSGAQLAREHRRGEHDVIRRGGCPHCEAADRDAPRARGLAGRIPAEQLRELLGDPRPTNGAH